MTFDKEQIFLFPGETLTDVIFDKGIRFDIVKKEESIWCGALGYAAEPLSVSNTLEYAYADWCAGQFARALGNEELAAEFERRGQAYRQVFNPEAGWFCPRNADGSWREWNPETSRTEEWFGCIESNLYQQGWFVPHDVPGLINLMGGKEKFAAKLDSLFSASSELTGELVSADITGLIGQYAHGNEPSHHIIHLYNYAGQPWKAQELVDRVFEEQYRVDPDGLSGNEDCGQMSAWLVLNAMGFYQVAPGNPVYSIGRPMFETLTVNLNNGKQFTVTAKNFSKANKYIKSATINGRELDEPFFNHSDIVEGGELVLEMTDAPTNWGVK